MADTTLLRALQGQAKSLNLSFKKLKKVPKLVGRIQTILQLDLKGNQLEELPYEITALSQLESLNLGNNSFEQIPGCIAYLYSLHVLHMFQNHLTILPDGLFNTLRNLKVLNLNNNHITKLPNDIHMLRSLEKLCLENNELRTLPLEVCALSRLKELRVGRNQLESLPLEFGFLSNLTELHVPLNKLCELPEFTENSGFGVTDRTQLSAVIRTAYCASKKPLYASMGKCYKLNVLDVAGNQLRIFPTETASLPLKELHYEGNPLLGHQPVHSVQEEEVLSLKEITARYVMMQLKDRFSPLRRQLNNFPELKGVLAQSSTCAVCSQPFLNTWLECVHFVKPKRLNLEQSSGTLDIPIRALLCSYTCFNKKNHEFYGVAFP